MKYIPNTDNALVLRTDFSDAAAWEALCAAIEEPVGEFKAYVEFVSDPVFDSISLEQLLSLVPKDSNHTYMFVVDRMALVQLEHPILVVDLYTEPGRSFRVVPAEVWGIENNLSTANMDFAEFADEADADGVFRGFPEG
jgi:hypothetical protein